MGKFLLAAVLLGNCSPSEAAGIRLVPPGAARAPVAPFVPNYAGSLALSLSGEPYFAGSLLGSLEGHLTRIVEMRTPREVQEYLQDAVVRPSGALNLKEVSAGLGKKALDARAASAILVANGLARPEQFQEILDVMERMKPAWGQRVAAMMKAAGSGRGGSGELLRRLREIGGKLKPSPYPGTYNASGELNGLFDGTK